MPTDNATDVTEAGRRLSEAVNMHLLGQGTAVAGRWIAARLSDGHADPAIYDTKGDAVRHQLHEQLCAYVRIPPDGMTPRQASVYLKFTRGLYDAGYRLQDPDQHMHLPMAPEQHGIGRLILPTPRRNRA